MLEGRLFTRGALPCSSPRPLRYVKYVVGKRDSGNVHHRRAFLSFVREPFDLSQPPRSNTYVLEVFWKIYLPASNFLLLSALVGWVLRRRWRCTVGSFPLLLVGGGGGWIDADSDLMMSHRSGSYALLLACRCCCCRHAAPPAPHRGRERLQDARRTPVARKEHLPDRLRPLKLHQQRQGKHVRRHPSPAPPRCPPPHP